MRHTLILSAALGALVAASAISAQVPNAELSMKIVQGRKENAARMKNYTWNSRTELVRDGKTVDIRIDQVMYGPDGNLQRTLINNDSFTHPKGLLFRRMIEQSKKEELEKYLKGLRGLLDQYTLPTAGKVVDFMASANVQFTSGAEGTPMLKIEGSGVVVPGDTLAIWADASTHEMRKVQITTTYEGGTANVTASYKTLGSGLTIMNLAEVELPDKNMSLQVHNYDYEPND